MNINSTTVLLILAGAAFGIWQATSAMANHAAINSAKVACAEFANKRKVFVNERTGIEDRAYAVDAWTKHDGRFVVVTVSNQDGGDKFQERLCVRGKTSIQIVGVMAENFWY